jgi:hypothetical protein
MAPAYRCVEHVLGGVSGYAAAFIDQMAEVYELSSLTIIASDGQNADSGLTGVGRERRRYQQKPFRVGDVHLMRTLNDTSRGRMSSHTGKWITRAWPFQEKLCSRKSLVFTAESVYWQYSEACWTEDTYGEPVGHAPI